MALKECVQVVENEVLNHRSNKLTLRAPKIVAQAKAGQFVMLECQQFLKRPYGILDTDQEKGTLELGIDRVGVGSRYQAALSPGAHLDCLGPLGQGFQFPDLETPLILLGGGSGIYPLIKAAKDFSGQTVVILGFRNKHFCLLNERFKKLSNEVILASDEGDLDFHGTSVEALFERHKRGDLKKATVFACGPIPMLQAAQDLCLRLDLSLQVSFEARMACGVGFCTGCTLPMKKGLPARCCYEGPVFPAEMIDWEALYA